jgi:hypothetical protein
MDTSRRTNNDQTSVRREDHQTSSCERVSTRGLDVINGKASCWVLLFHQITSLTARSHFQILLDDMSRRVLLSRPGLDMS